MIVAQNAAAATDLKRLIEAALDQPKPSRQLVTSLNRVLRAIEHPLSLDARRAKEAA